MELAGELNIREGDKEDAYILQLLKLAQRPLSIKELLFGLYRKFGVELKRNALSTRLYRLTKGEEITTTGKGGYALPEPATYQKEKGQ